MIARRYWVTDKYYNNKELGMRRCLLIEGGPKPTLEARRGAVEILEWNEVLALCLSTVHLWGALLRHH